VLHSAEGYVEQGMASWYGPQFHGRPTASGETFDQYALSAAHRTLPLHTWVEVTNLENGERLVVRVNDRGPFAHTDQRIIDLSFGAAQRLGVIARGTARVEVRALPEETGG
jgi:rare lipoprotein A